MGGARGGRVFKAEPAECNTRALNQGCAAVWTCRRRREPWCLWWLCMISLTEWAVVVVVAGFFSALFSLIAGVIVLLFLDRKMISTAATVRGERGLQARADKKARLAEVFQRAAELKAEKKPLGEILQTCALEFPDVALEVPGHLSKMAKKLGLDEAGL